MCGTYKNVESQENKNQAYVRSKKNILYHLIIKLFRSKYFWIFLELKLRRFVGTNTSDSKRCSCRSVMLLV